MVERATYPEIELYFPEAEPPHASACVLNAEEVVIRLGGEVIRIPGPVEYMTYYGSDGAENFHAVAVLPDGKVVDLNRATGDRVFGSYEEYLELGITLVEE
jgi:hypothetical protein